MIYSYMIPQGGYAPNGNILAHTDSVMGDWLFSYDAMDRLTAAAAGGSAPSAFRGQSAGWSYDSYGNRTAQSFTNSVNSSWANYNPANNQITTASTAVAGYVYDASGNTLNDGNNEYWYDAEGQLCAVQSQAVAGLPITQYIYDAEGARIGKGTLSAAPPNSTSLCAPPLGSGFTLTTRYLVDQGGNQVTEFSEQGMPTPATEVWQHSNVFSAARLAATYDYNGGNGGLHYALADPLGTKRVQANTTGIVEEWYVSLPYGDGLTPIFNPACTAANYCYPEDATEHHFTQKERDAESGNDYFFARYYNSALGRFTTPDWSAKEEPVPYAVFTDPQSLNLYAYVRNNPITRVDADGHEEPWCLCQVIENIQNIKLPTKQDFQVGAVVVATVGVMVLHNLNPLNAFHKDAPPPAATPAPSETPAPAATPAATPEGEPHAPGDVTNNQVVVRGGQTPPPSSGTYSGSQGATVEEAGRGVPNNQVQVTTGGQIRAAGGDVRPAPEAPYPGASVNGQHVNVTGGQGAFSPPRPNPAPKDKRLKTKPQN